MKRDDAEENAYFEKLGLRVHALGITMDEFLNQRLNAYRLAVMVTGRPEAITDKEIREEADRCLDSLEAMDPPIVPMAMYAKRESGGES